ncbi:Ppx/GppA phosphatase family protein [Alkalibaculum sporogenes]|nr:Ppx/GppA phosphatase family protein [Alkalibaculum sporogenes]
MQKYSIIDIGTNSTRLLVASVEDKKIVNREKYLISTRLGQGVDSNKLINKETLEKNIDALREFKEISESYGVVDYIIFGTSALRDAKNSNDFVRLAQEKLQLSVNIIEGRLEAEYAFLGVRQVFQNQDIVIMDIGGGSTEVVYASKGKIINSNSLNIGAVRLTERFIKNDPPLDEELEKMRIYINKMLRDNLTSTTEEFELIGIGGTATTISAIKQSLRKYEPEKIQGSTVLRSELDRIEGELTTLSDSKRKEIIGLNPQRSDIISAGAIILESILDYYEKDLFIVSDYDNLEGALFNYLKI